MLGFTVINMASEALTKTNLIYFRRGLKILEFKIFQKIYQKADKIKNRRKDILQSKSL